MLLKSNVPEGHDDWTLTTCPECGATCWQETYWKMMEALEQIKAADSSKAEKLRGAVRAAVDEMK